LQLALSEARYTELMQEADRARFTSTRIGYLAAVEKAKETAAVADYVGGARGAILGLDADVILSSCLVNLGDMAAGARAACSALQAARASDRTMSLVSVLCVCGGAADVAPDEMLKTERESREQERLNGSPPSLGGLDLSQVGQISLPTTPAALPRLGLAYYKAAVSICDDAHAAARDRGSPLAANNVRLLSSRVEARARGCLGVRLQELGEERKRSLKLVRQAVALSRMVLQLSRMVLQIASPGRCALEAKMTLIALLNSLSNVEKAPGSNTAAAACLR